MTHRTVLALFGALILACLIVIGAMRYAGAQSQQVVACAPLPDLLKALQSRFSEFAIIRFKGAVGEYLMTRSATGRWTLIRVMGEAGCILSVGETSEVDRGI